MRSNMSFYMKMKIFYLNIFINYMNFDTKCGIKNMYVKEIYYR